MTDAKFDKALTASFLQVASVVATATIFPVLVGAYKAYVFSFIFFVGLWVKCMSPITLLLISAQSQSVQLFLQLFLCG